MPKEYVDVLPLKCDICGITFYRNILAITSYYDFCSVECRQNFNKIHLPKAGFENPEVLKKAQTVRKAQGVSKATRYKLRLATFENWQLGKYKDRNKNQETEDK